MNENKSMIITNFVCQMNKELFLTVIKKNYVEDHLWLPFLDQSQSDVVVLQ